jgi:predicted transcriptional regulator with HTH domain
MLILGQGRLSTPKQTARCSTAVIEIYRSSRSDPSNWRGVLTAIADALLSRSTSRVYMS